MKNLPRQVIFFLIIGFALLIVAIPAIISQLGSDEESSEPTTTTTSEDGGAIRVVEIRGLIGGEKEDFMEDEQVQSILEQRYGLRVDFRREGSIEMVSQPPDLNDFLWPSNEVALALFEENNSSVGDEIIFNSPIVVYSWVEVADALIAAGYVEDRGGILYMDMQAFIDYIFTIEDDDGDGPEWEDIGLADITNPINIISTDPTESNSGNMFYGLLINLLSEGSVATDETVNAVMPTVRAYYDSLGLLESSSGTLFNKYVQQGRGAYPLVIGYESQLIGFSLQNEQNLDVIQDRMRIIYPEPTVWSSHPLIALTEEGEQLIEALQDEEIQTIAWESYGFRSGFIGIDNDPAVLQVGAIPENIDVVIALPRPSVMSTLIRELSR